MNKVIFVVLAWTLVQTFAEELPQWYPTNLDEILSKCKSDNPLSAKDKEQMSKDALPDRPEVRALLVCIFKGMNIYSSDKGFNVDRLADSVYRSSNSPCSLIMARECVAKYKSGKAEDAFIFNVMKCITGEVKKNVVSPACNYKP